MEQTESGKSKGYQKQVKKEATPAKPKKSGPIDYASPAAKKWPKFVEALEAGDAETVRKLIEEGVNVSVLRDGITPLMLAASKGQAAVAEVILQAGVNINERDGDAETALHKAARDQEGAGVVELLLQSGIDVRARNKTAKTALQLAEEHNHKDIVHVLSKHLDQEQEDSREWEQFLNSPEGKPYKQQQQLDKLESLAKLWWVPVVALGGLGLVVGLLANAPVIAGGIGLTLAAGTVAAFRLKMTLLKKYLDEIGPLPELDLARLREMKRNGESLAIPVRATGGKAAAETHGEAPAVAASAEVSEDAVAIPAEDDGFAEEVIAPRQAEPKPAFFANGKSKKAVYAALAAGIVLLLAGALFLAREPLSRWFFVQKLERGGARFTEQGFIDAVAANREETVDWYLRAGMTAAARNAKAQTALFIATERGYADLVQKLARLAPSSIDRYDANGMTPLMTAARQGSEPMVKLLLANGAAAGFTVPDRDGPATALHAALDAPEFKEQHARIMLALIEKGAPVNGRNAAGQFPLLFAAVKGRRDAAALLIEKGAAVNDADRNGVFPLLAASCKGYTELVALLSDKGADLNQAMPDGMTPLMCAAAEGHGDAARVLLDHGAKINAKSAGGETALGAACKAGNIPMAQMLLAQGADPAGVAAPDALVTIPAKTVTLNARKHRMGDALKLIAAAAAKDGYTLALPALKRTSAGMNVKAEWNKALIALAGKNSFLLVMKNKTITILPYDPAAVKRQGT